MSSKQQIRDLVVNRRARFEYELTDSFEAGLALTGSEVKSLRDGRGNLQEAYVRLQGGEAFLMQCHISPYAQANRNNHEALRPRKLLLNAAELAKLDKAVGQKGMTIVPKRLYLKGRLIKLEIALGKGKKLHDKRHSLKAKDAKRDMDRRK